MFHPLAAAVAPAATSAVLLAVFAGFLAKREKRPEWARIAAVLAGGAGAAIGIALVVGTATFQPRQATDRIGICLAVLVLTGVVETLLLRRAPFRISLRGLTVAILGVVILFPLARNAWPISVSIGWIAATTAIVLLLWESLDAGARRDSPALVAGVLLLALAGGSVLMLLGGSAKLATLAGGIVSAFGGIAVMTWINPKRFSLSAGTAAIWPLSALVWLMGSTYSETPIVPMLLALASSQTYWFAQLPILKKRVVWQQFAACGTASSALLAIALLIAYRAYSASATEYGY